MCCLISNGYTTRQDGEIYFKFEERLPSADPRPQEDLDNFKKMVEYWLHLRDKLKDGEITGTEYYLKEIKFPNPIVPDKEYTVPLNLDEDDHLFVRNLDEDEKAAETAALLDLFPDFSYVKRRRKLSLSTNTNSNHKLIKEDSL